MAIEDMVEENGRLVYKPLWASPGDVITCPSGHAVCDVIGKVRTGIAQSSDFANWRDGDQDKYGKPFKDCNCHICGENPWWDPRAKALRPRTQNGWRVLPTDAHYHDDDKD